MPTIPKKKLDNNLIEIIKRGDGSCDFVNSYRTTSLSRCECHLNDYCVKNSSRLPDRGLPSKEVLEEAIRKALELKIIDESFLFDMRL